MQAHLYMFSIRSTSFVKTFLLLILLFESSARSQNYSPTSNDDKRTKLNNSANKSRPGDFIAENSDSEAEKISGFIPARGADKSGVDLGLALSGGGVRSASFSIGVMKALYDAGIMDDVDVISSVSGGGYASYWLYTKYNPSSGEKFGHAAFGNEAFIQSLCELQGNASVFPFKSEIKALFGTRKGAFSSYESALEQSFGNKMVSKPKLDFLKGAIGEARAPYFIINATLR